MLGCQRHATALTRFQACHLRFCSASFELNMHLDPYRSTLCVAAACSQYLKQAFLQSALWLRWAKQLHEQALLLCINFGKTMMLAVFHGHAVCSGS